MSIMVRLSDLNYFMPTQSPVFLKAELEKVAPVSRMSDPLPTLSGQPNAQISVCELC
jgi:hypothetical protein